MVKVLTSRFLEGINLGPILFICFIIHISTVSKLAYVFLLKCINNAWLKIRYDLTLLILNCKNFYISLDQTKRPLLSTRPVT
jgi:hypothetical protein